MTILIDKLLQACVKQGASDIHIVVGQPPVFRLHGRMRKLETKVLEADDSVALMKSIAPERSQRELQEKGSAVFSSHVLEVVEQVCSRVVILKEGHIVGHDSVDHLRNTLKLPTLDAVFATLVEENNLEQRTNALVAAMHLQ